MQQRNPTARQKRSPSLQCRNGLWRHADLLGSPYPRPYQYEAYAVFRGHGYQGQVVEAPTDLICS